MAYFSLLIFFSLSQSYISQCLIWCCPPEYARFTAAWLLHLTLDAKVKPPLHCRQLSAKCISRFGKMLITSQHMANPGVYVSIGWGQTLSLQHVHIHKKTHRCLTSTRRADAICSRPRCCTAGVWCKGRHGGGRRERIETEGGGGQEWEV